MNWYPAQSVWDQAERRAEDLRRRARVAGHGESSAAESTVDALMYSLRRGLWALGPSDPLQRDTLWRLSELSEAQLSKCCEALQKRKPQIGPAWTETEVAALVLAWGAMRQ